jgi:hypothetical protein
MFGKPVGLTRKSEVAREHSRFFPTGEVPRRREDQAEMVKKFVRLTSVYGRLKTVSQSVSESVSDTVSERVSLLVNQSRGLQVRAIERNSKLVQ